MLRRHGVGVDSTILLVGWPRESKGPPPSTAWYLKDPSAMARWLSKKEATDGSGSSSNMSLFVVRPDRYVFGVYNFSDDSTFSAAVSEAAASISRLLGQDAAVVSRS